MPEVGLGEFDDQEALKNSLEAFEKIKKGTQDLILERTSVVPDDTIKEIEKKFAIPIELAKTIFVLEFEYLIPRKLSSNFYLFEMKRLAEAQYELPDIYSFKVRFSMEEGFWIKYLVVDLPKKLEQKMKKLTKFNQSLFGSLEGDKEDAALYIIERAYICSEIIRPIMQSWMNDHHRATFHDCVGNFMCGIQQKAREKCCILVEEIGLRFDSQIDSIRDIITNIRPQGWILKAKEEYNKIDEKLVLFSEDNMNLDWRLAAEIILESMLMRELEGNDILDITSITKGKLEKTAHNVTKIINTKTESYITDDISNILTKIEGQPLEKQTPLVKELIVEKYTTATIKNREKPAIFSRTFLERFMTEIGLNHKEIKKITKKFDVQLMFRLSPAGGKEFPNMSIDEKIIGLIEEFAFGILTKQKELKSHLSIDAKDVKLESTSDNEKTEPKEQIDPKKENISEKLKESTDKELWVFVRDIYLKELFDSDKELLAGARILKKYSLELGLLMTEGEATTYITTELEKKGFSIDTSSSEDIDSNICKIIFKQLKELRKY